MELEVVAYVFLLEMAPMVPDRGVDLIEEEGNLSPHWLSGRTRLPHSPPHPPSFPPTNPCNSTNKTVSKDQIEAIFDYTDPRHDNEARVSFLFQIRAPFS